MIKRSVTVTDYKTRTTQIMVHPADNPTILSEMVTTVSIDDEGGGEYVRAESARAIERDVAFRQRDLAYKQRDEAELKWSQARQENRDLHERIGELETAVKVFRGCIETGEFPESLSPVHHKIIELVGGRDQ